MVNLTENEKYIIEGMQKGAKVVVTHITPIYARLKSDVEEHTVMFQDISRLQSLNLINLTNSEDEDREIKTDYYELTEAGRIWPEVVVVKPPTQKQKLPLLLILLVGLILILYVILRSIF